MHRTTAGELLVLALLAVPAAVIVLVMGGAL
jgi:hypothetical protein